MSRGAAWEAQLERLHDRYRRDERAVVLRVHPAVKVLGKQAGARFVGTWSTVGPPDFVGALANGRGVAIDAKSIEAARFPLHQLERHQARDLEGFHCRGAAAGVALRDADGAAWWLDWKRLGPAYWRWADGDAVRGEASLVPEQWGSPFDVAGDGWLPAVVSNG